MASATGRVTFKIEGDHCPIPFEISRPLKASVAPKRGWLMGHNAAGLAVAQDGTTPNLISLGPAERDQAAGATDSAAKITVTQNIVSGYQVSTTANDGFTNADVCVPAWAVDNQTIGKLSNSGSSNRSLLGLVFGLDPDNGTPWLWASPIAHAVARGVILASNHDGGTYQYTADATAATDITDQIIPRPALHGVITAVDFLPSAALTASATVYKTITIKKYSGVGAATGVTVATLVTDVAGGDWVARVAKAFTLTSTAADLQLLEGDLLTVTTTHASTGTVIPAGAIRVKMQVL